jgi:SSS family solute:Na+ symporter
MITAFAVSLTLQLGGGFDNDKPLDFAWIMLITVLATSLVWLAVTFLTRPESEETLLAFYRRVRPGVTGWGPVARLATDVRSPGIGYFNLLDWLCGCVLIYGCLFGTGKLLLGETAVGSLLVATGVVAGAVIYWDLSRRGWSSVVE